MKITLSRVKKKIIKEFEIITGIILGALLINTLLSIWPGMSQVLRGVGKNLETGVRNIETAINNLNISDDKKKALLEKLESAKAALESKLQDIKKNIKDIQSTDIPSKQIAAQIDNLRLVIQEIQNIYDSQDSEDETVEKALEEADEKIAKVSAQVKNMDFISALYSKEQDAGLWKSMNNPEKYIKGDNEWLDFITKLSEIVPDEEKKKLAAESET